MALSRAKQATRAVAVAAAVLLMASCSDSGGDGASSGAAAKTREIPASGPLADAAAHVKLLERPIQNPTGEPLKKLPTGDTVVVVSNAQQVSQETNAAFKQAAEGLGLRVTIIDGGQTASSISAAWDQAVAAKPDFVIGSGWPVTVFQRQLDELNANGGKFIGYATGQNGPKPAGYAANLESLEDYGKLGGLSAEYSVVHNAGDLHVLVTYPVDFLVGHAYKDQYIATLKKLCPSCTATELPVKTADIGTKSPGQIVSAIQRDPKINYVEATYDAIYAGTPEALKQAGLQDRVKTISEGGGPVIFNAVKNGDVQAVLAVPNPMRGWQLADTVARAAAGQSLPKDPFGPTGLDFPEQIITKDNLNFDPNSLWAGPNGYQDAYRKIWGVS
jgi:ribose transport system substrate-binding protein